MSSPLTTTKGAITQVALLSRFFRTHLTVRGGILKRYLKETFYLSFPFPCSPEAPGVTEPYKLRNARVRQFGDAVRFFSAVNAYSLIPIISLTVAGIVFSSASQG